MTNNFNLPEPLYRAILNDTYIRRGDISVTQLISAPRTRYLKKKHYKEIEEDAIDSVWALFGQACHAIIERASEGCDNYMPEVALELDVLGQKLSGTADLYHISKKTLYDFKVTSVWNLVLNDDHWEWEAQTNTYAYLLRKAGYEVDEIKIIAILKDWKQSEAEKNYATGNYPLKQIAEVDIKVYNDKAMLSYIEKRMQMHIDVMDGKEIDCTDRERWARPDKFAILDPAKKRALKVCNSQEEAGQYIEMMKAKKYKGSMSVEVRKGKDIKCEGYCAVAEFCPQFNK